MELIDSIFSLIAFGYMYGDPIVTTLLLAICIMIFVSGLILLGTVCYYLYRTIKFIVSKKKIRKEDSIMSDKQDKTIVCKDCGKEFTFTVGEQEFYEQHQFSDPVRCKECREARKANFNK